VSLVNVWVKTWADGLVRADQIVGIDAHPTPAIAGKPSRWLVDAVLAAPVGSGSKEQWGMTVLHRTLIQTGTEPRDAPVALARLLAQLDLVSAAGVITVNVEPSGSAGSVPASPRGGEAPTEEDAGARSGRAAEVRGGRVEESRSGQLRFRFAPFAHPEPGRHTDREYL
jgi:hypothetical protein